MRAQIIAILLVAVFSCEATYLPGSYGLGGANYGAPGLGYPSSPVLNAVSPYTNGLPYNTAGAVAYVVPSGYGNYIVVSDAAASPYGSNYAVAGPGYGVSPKTAGYASPYGYAYGSNLGAYGNLVYPVKK
ncbi:uncharacterized protein LOC129972065 [Argiope bruennichi]|uniref:Uncharacterized protein n=1 Tax=Argiope bruennichi TaxID=94029 RepID=A0A8T0E3C1_ARGBR|nr:uncharacterized protein LOC129972065 [Argiope bruennichi]KAF8764697.1 hypothetical protein HNY73_022750 [Argiope bruennichi]